MSIPLMKNCRVDYTKLNGQTYSILVECDTNLKLYYVAEGRNLKDIYSEFKFICRNGIAINNLSIQLHKLTDVNYII